MAQPRPDTGSRPAGEPIYVVNPRAKHTHTVILLHGLSSNGEQFGAELLETGTTSSGRRLTDLLPGARFVFPTSKRRRSTAFGRSMLTQWFDLARLQEPEYRKELQLQGLAESAEEVLQIVQDELKLVTRRSLVMGGLSQGCAMSLAILLCLEQPIGGYIGMSSWLSFQPDLEIAIADDDPSDDPFSNDDAPQSSEDRIVKAQTFERDLLCLASVTEPASAPALRSTPVFLGHGSADEKVPCALGEAAARVFRDVGYEVCWKKYEGQRHWYTIPEEIDDVVDFISGQVGWKVQDLEDSVI